MRQREIPGAKKEGRRWSVPQNVDKIVKIGIAFRGKKTIVKTN